MKTTILLALLFLTLNYFHGCSCSEDKSDTSTNIKSSNEDSINSGLPGEDFSQPDSTPFPGLTPPTDGQHSNKNHQSKSNHHETLLRVVDQSFPDQDPTTEWNLRSDPIIETGEMVMEDVREGDISSKDYDGTNSKRNTDNRPNIILIMTDDQDVELGSMEYMPETLKIFRDNGIEFRHGYVSTPMCCPSRSSILTGRYVHNHNTYTNNDNCSSVLWREKYEKRTFGAYLWSSGYHTSYIGKYLNKYDGSHVPYGWDEWNGLLMNSRFYNYTVNVNGKKFRHGFEESDYYPDVIASDTLEFLSRVGNDESRRPFLLVSSFPSPHGPEDSAPQYSKMFMNVTTHHTPSYNFAPNSDKQWILRTTNPMTPILKEFTDLLMTKRLQTLQTVDVAVKSIMDNLKATGLDKNTYVFYTSDHGYHVGQFGLVKGKSMPYEFDIRVPFFLHGPPTDVKRGIQILEPVMNIDLAPTFLDLAGISIPDEIDGRSLVPLIKRYASKPTEDNTDMPFIWKDVFLIESSGRRDPPSTPAQNNKSQQQQPSKKTKKSRDEKRKMLQTDNETLRMNTLCLLHPYPCLPGQRRYCRNEMDQVEKVQFPNFRKCRPSDFLEDSLLSRQTNGSLHQSTRTNSDGSINNTKRCRCRYKRSSDLIGSDDLNWDKERATIDEEIDALKKRIDELRQRRRSMRRKWLLQNNYPTTTAATEVSSYSTPIPKRRGKGHNVLVNKDANVEDKVFSVGDFEKNEDELTSLPPPTTVTSRTKTTTTEKESEEEDDEDDDLDEDEDDEEDDNDTSEDEEEDEEEDELIPVSPPTTTSLPSTTTTATTTTTSTTPLPTKRSPVYGKGSHNKSNHVTFQRRPILGAKKRRPELGLDFESDFELDSFVRHKHRNKNRHKNRHRPRVFGPVDTGDVKEVAEGISKWPTNNGESQVCDCHNDPQWIRQREREERKRRKLLSKFRKKQKYMKRIEDPEVRKQAETCGAEEKMNCFWHDSDHWKTAPFWTSGSFCFCMNSNNNTYSCLRSVNSTHNYLYCQFVTGFKMYFDLRQDPFQLVNAIGTLPAQEEDWMLVQLIRLKRCKGRAECWGEIDVNEQAIQSSIWEQIFGRWPRKKKRGHRRKQVNAF